MKIWVVLLLLTMAGLGSTILPANAQSIEENSGNRVRTCQSATLTSGLNTGQAVACMQYPSVVPTATSTFPVVVYLTTPILTAPTTVSFNFGSGRIGCGGQSGSGPGQFFGLKGDSGPLITGTTQQWIISRLETMASDYCTGVLYIQFSLSPADILTFTLPWYTTSMGIPVNTAITGTLNVNAAITSWPNLVSTVTNSGTVNVVNSGGQALTLSGTLNSVQSGAVTVTNTGGQAITVTSWPQLNAVLSGRVNTNATMVSIGNSTVNFPSTLHLCGATLMNGTCAPINTTSSAVVTTPNAATDFSKGVLSFWPLAVFAATFLLPKRGGFAGTALRITSLLAAALLLNLPGPGRFAFVVLALAFLGFEALANESSKQKGDYSLPY